jgi:DNA-binding NtrC family response regulator
MSVDVLVIDDEPMVRNAVAEYLSRNGFNAEAAVDGKDGLELIRRKEYDVAIVDLVMPGISGMELIHKIKSLRPDTEIIVYTGQASLDTAIEAIRHQAFDYICKPADMATLTRRVQHAAERRFLILQNRELICKLENERNGLQKEVKASKHAIKKHILSSPEFVGESKDIAYVRHMISEVAPSDMTVLIRGESGTGKDVVARLIHKWSGRADTGHFVKINCPAISETLLESEMFGHEKGSFTGAVKRKPGRFEFAAGGTIFLDEIGSIPRSVQAKLLQVIEHKQFTRLGGNETIEVDARIISSTNAHLEKMIANSEFRSDLFYRIEQFAITLPPLRERREDIPLLVEHFLYHYCSKYGHTDITIPPEMMSLLVEHDWPGNVRQLKAVIGRFALNGDIKALEEAVAPSQDHTKESPSFSRLSENEIKSIMAALTETNWNRREAAKLLGTSYSTLRRKIEKHNIMKVPYHSQIPPPG